MEYLFPSPRFQSLCEMTTHSSVLAWRIPGTGEPGGLPSMESHRVRHDWSDLAADLKLVSCRQHIHIYIYKSCSCIHSASVCLLLGAFNLFRVKIIINMYSLVAQMIKNLPAMPETQIRSLGEGRSPGEANGYPLQYSCLENSMDIGAWWITVHGSKESNMTEWLTHTHILIAILLN